MVLSIVIVLTACIIFEANATFIFVCNRGPFESLPFAIEYAKRCNAAKKSGRKTSKVIGLGWVGLYLPRTHCTCCTAHMLTTATKYSAERLPIGSDS